MEIALGVLGFTPKDFWQMTPPEWLAALKGWKKKYGMKDDLVPDITRADIERLMGLYPD
jgi:uncharacterized phage protein (TIGR02216 family)